ncbi:methyltransferase domain-containing protein [Streptacidiphilus sp. ASG 303]|uniref:class I SAM-dependent methyltransferase n=1 Tax=Streptacidiphilus sp. ASG 303 TaxID=2896847 RepID=UPI001E52C130|nr:methyltransferase domain-containing protein [Streptacidiphilus sp. ASG 303]MCD0485736.1 methyltransferase domain-containing protein [Streptacidiphilus sp. ASG 303]
MPSTREQSPAERRKAWIARSFDLASDSYDEANGPFFNPVGERLVDLAGLRPGDRVLDVGCGRGAVLFAAVAAVGPDGYVAGVDLSPAMVRRTAAQAAGAGLRNVSVRVGDAEDPGFPDGSFEAVLSSFSLVLTPDPAAALARARRLLAPDGRFGTTSFGPDPEPAWREAVRVLRDFADPEAAGAYARPFNALADDPEGMLAAAGFAGVRTVEGTTATEFADLDAWWRSAWADGHRGVLETIPPDRREEARRAACAVVAPLAGSDGRLVRRTAVRWTIARRG